MILYQNKSGQRKSWLVIFAAGIFLTVAGTTHSYWGNQYIQSVLGKVQGHLISKPINALRARLKHKPLPTFNLNVSFKHCQDFLKKRNEAIKKGILLPTFKEFVPGELVVDSVTYPIKLRLKGDWTDHLLKNKWSFRMRTKSTQLLFGMREFGIQRPETRNGINEWAFFENLRQEGILTPRYQFINLVFNGADKGVYALEEGFSKELLESQNRRESYLLRFDEDVMWEQRSQFYFTEVKNSHTQVLGPGPDHDYTPVDVFNLKPRNFENKESFRQLQSALGLLNQAFSQKGTASEIFDVELIARFLAVTELWDAKHGVEFHNMRFYFNPVTYRLEPIGFDSGAGTRNGTFLSADRRLVQYILSDPIIAKRFVEVLGRISKKEYLVDLKNSLENNVARYQAFLKADVSWTELDWKFLGERQTFIRNSLNPASPVEAYASLDREKNRLNLEIKNLTKLPIEVTGLRFSTSGIQIKGKNFSKNWPAQSLLDSSTIIVSKNQNPGFNKINIKLPISLNQISLSTEKIFIESSIVGIKEKKEVEVRNYLPPVFISGAPLSPSKTEFLKRHPFILSKKNGIYTIPSGTYSIKSNLVTPLQSTLLIEPGSTLKFWENAGLIVRGDLNSLGTANRPIFFTSEGKQWAGIYVEGHIEGSTMRYTTVSKAASQAIGGWVLTGAVTFYQSKVSIFESRFLSTPSEDLVNFFQSPFKIVKSHFSETASDAVDSDFSDGEIRESFFSDIKGDAIDVSGSQVQISDVSATNIGDKAISAGERSTINAQNIKVTKTKIGIASKDNSKVVADRVSIAGVEIALIAFQKKPEFGPATFEASQIEFEKTKTSAIVQLGSNGRLNGALIKPQKFDISSIYGKE